MLPKQPRSPFLAKYMRIDADIASLAHDLRKASYAGQDYRAIVADYVDGAAKHATAMDDQQLVSLIVAKLAVLQKDGGMQHTARIKLAVIGCLSEANAVPADAMAA